MVGRLHRLLHWVRLAVAAAAATGLAAYLALALGLVANFQSASSAERSAPAKNAATQDAQLLASKIDQLLAKRWAAEGVKPARLTNDAEFVRRAYLDLAGRIPQIHEAHDFLDDDAPDKRQRLVDRLLSRPRGDEPYWYGKHFAEVWRAVLLPAAMDPERPYPLSGFEGWLFDRFGQNAGFDQMVREILTAPSSGGGDKSPIAFFQSNEGKPENLAASTARLFLGIKLECAQCHNHPHEHWTRDQFWEFAAFFINEKAQSKDRREIQIPGTEKKVAARFPDGTNPQWKVGDYPPATLAQWLTTAKNPFFARAAVNRFWAYFFGIGLIEPVDEASPQNLPSHPELLDELAKQFAAHHFDVQFLIRAITTSQAYQRSSMGSHAGQSNPRLFARMAVRGLSPEQLFDSLAVATDFQEPAHANQNRFTGNEVKTPRAEFLARFTHQDKPTDVRTSILQALHLMNGKFMADATSVKKNVALATTANAAESTAKRIEELYLNTLSRKPRPDEAARLVKYVGSGGASGDPKEALADVFWALLNSSEFMLNH